MPRIWVTVGTHAENHTQNNTTQHTHTHTCTMDPRAFLGICYWQRALSISNSPPQSLKYSGASTPEPVKHARTRVFMHRRGSQKHHVFPFFSGSPCCLVNFVCERAGCLLWNSRKPKCSMPNKGSAYGTPFTLEHTISYHREAFKARARVDSHNFVCLLFDVFRARPSGHGTRGCLLSVKYLFLKTQPNKQRPLQIQGTITKGWTNLAETKQTMALGLLPRFQPSFF